MPKDLVKKPLKWFTLETIGNFTYDQLGALWRSAVLTGIVAALWRFYGTMPLDVRLTVGLFAVALVFFGLDRYVTRRRNRPIAPASGQTAPTNDRTQELEVELDALKTQYKWLFDIADEQKSKIHLYIHLTGYEINRHELLRDSPYIEFRFTFDSTSVYPVRLNDMGGSIYFQRRRLSGAPKWVDNDRKDIPPLKGFGPVMIRQEISSDDAIFILNELGSSARFDFREVEIGVESPDHPEVKRQLLYFTDKTTTNEALLKAYPS